MAAFNNVRALERGLEVLQAVNSHRSLRANDVARIVGIPRPTAYRLLETMENMGLLTRGHSDGAWSPTLRVKALSSGFRDEHWVAQNAVPRMMRLGREVLWPLDLVTIYDFRMVVRESTHNISPFSIDHGVVGREMPILETSGGRAYLAFCPDDEREQILQHLARTGEAERRDSDPTGIEQILERTRELGVGYRTSGYNPHTKSISAPIFRDGRPIASLSLIWIAKTLDFDKALADYRVPLMETAQAISDDLHDLAEPQEDARSSDS